MGRFRAAKAKTKREYPPKIQCIWLKRALHRTGNLLPTPVIRIVAIAVPIG